MSTKVDHNEDFKKSTPDWQDLLTEVVGGAKMTSHHRGCVGNQVQSDSIFLNTVHNNLYYGKVVHNPAWQTLVPVLNAPGVCASPLITCAIITYRTMLPCNFYFTQAIGGPDPLKDLQWGHQLPLTSKWIMINDLVYFTQTLFHTSFITSPICFICHSSFFINVSAFIPTCTHLFIPMCTHLCIWLLLFTLLQSTLRLY